MTHFRPQTDLETHTVTNQPTALENINLFQTDRALQGALEAFSGGVYNARLQHFGERCGAAETQTWARQANENPPQLKSFDRFGQRLDEIEFHPAYHRLMELGIGGGVSGAPWSVDAAGHVLHGALMILLNQADAGVTCPMSMSYASVAPLTAHADVGAHWVEKIKAQSYDPAFVPAAQKSGVTIGMAMTEKQGGSDVRANTTRAEEDGNDGYLLTGHKWFCSAPMSDAFLTLAYTENGLTCFLAPRWTPDGRRNNIHVMRLKDKMGDKSNASSEIEYHRAWAQRIGDEGRGVRTIIDMVQLTRYDCILGSTGGMRAALSQALWHAAQRHVFQKALVDQPAMRAVLADLIIEYEAALALALRVGASIDSMTSDATAAAFMRLATPAAKYWVCKRQPGFVYEALECLGGAGYVEEGPMPRLFRQSPLNAIWEGSGNVIALDLLRAVGREPDSLEAVLSVLENSLGRHRAFDAHVDHLKSYFTPGALHEARARAFAQDLALALQGAALSSCAPDFVFDAFCLQRLAYEQRGFVYGDLATGVDIDRLIERSMPYA
ncbi:MAG: acyl-CoA dehydrogenase family protein [Pseudomonadota bacterium]